MVVFSTTELSNSVGTIILQGWVSSVVCHVSFSLRIKIGLPQPPYHPPKQGQKATFYNLCLMSMKFGMEVTFGGIQIKKEHKVSGPC